MLRNILTLALLCLTSFPGSYISLAQAKTQNLNTIERTTKNIFNRNDIPLEAPPLPPSHPLEELGCSIIKPKSDLLHVAIIAQLEENEELQYLAHMPSDCYEKLEYRKEVFKELQKH